MSHRMTTKLTTTNCHLVGSKRQVDRWSTLVGCICDGTRTENERTRLPVRLSSNPDASVASLERLVDLSDMKCRTRGRRQGYGY